MKLFTKPQYQQLLKNGTGQNRGQDHFPVVKLFTPDAQATWLLTDIDPEDPDMAFGLCDLGMGYPEMGYVSLNELTSLRGKLGLPIERELHFVTTHPLSVYAEAARSREEITTASEHLAQAAIRLETK